ncbi:MAG: LLM class flavin-dependent oxidoreductase [Bacteroidota bacterium]
MEIPHLLRTIREQGIDLRWVGDSLELVSEQDTIDPEVVTLIKEHKPAIIAYLKSITSESDIQVIPMAAVQERYSVTATQFRFWILCQLEEINVAYNMPLVVKIEGNLEVDVLERSLEMLMERHELLRSQFIQEKNGVLNQWVLNLKDLDFQLHRLKVTRSGEIHDTLSQLVMAPFDLKSAPLFRAHLVSTEGETHYLCLTIHHMICDGLSLGILLNELQKLYNSLVNGQATTLPELPLQFKDYSQWINEKQNYGNEETYWLETFADEIPILNMPTFQPRPHIKTYNGATYQHVFEASVVPALSSFSGEQGGTNFMALMSALNGLLHRYTSQTDIVLGTPVSGRNNPQLEGQVGLYINTLPIRTRFHEDSSYLDLFNIQKEVLGAAYENANYPFGELVANLDLQRDISRSPIFDVLVTYQTGGSLEARQAGFVDLECTVYSDYDDSASKYDLTFMFAEDDGRLSLGIEYNTDLFQENFIAALATHLENFLKECLTTPEKQLRYISYIDAREVDRLLHGLNDTNVDFNSKATFLDAFVAQVAQTPKAVAFVSGDIAITYDELDERSSRLANYLTQNGLLTGAIAGVCLERSIEMAIGMLGILKTGAAYLPLDPFYPLDRIDYIIAHSKAQMILTKGITSQLVSISSEAIDLEDPEIWQSEPRWDQSLVKSEATAYTIYTSGSTGKPKGVSVSHGNLMNFMVGMNERFPESEVQEVWMAITSISFDISILELLWTLTRGSKVVIHLERPVPITPQPEMNFSFFYFPTGESTEGDKYKLLVEGAKFADDHGFEAIWVPERHFHSFGDQFPNPSVAAAAVSTITNNIKLRSGSVVLPLHDSVRVAEEWSMIDN